MGVNTAIMEMFCYFGQITEVIAALGAGFGAIDMAGVTYSTLRVRHTPLMPKPTES